MFLIENTKTLSVTRSYIQNIYVRSLVTANFMLQQHLKYNSTFDCT